MASAHTRRATASKKRLAPTNSSSSTAGSSADGDDSGSNQPPTKRSKTAGDNDLNDLIIQRDKAEAEKNLLMQKWENATNEKTKDLLRKDYEDARTNYNMLVQKVANVQEHRLTQAVQAPVTWLLEATVHNCVSVHNTRCNTYRLASTLTAYRTPGPVTNDPPIYYTKPGGKNLNIKLFFKSEDNVVRFRNHLIIWGQDSTASLFGKVQDTDITFSPIIDVPPDLVPVSVADYVRTEDDESPEVTHVSASIIPVDADVKYQMVERVAPTGGVNRCHILQRKNLAAGDPRKGWDRTNLIFLYPHTHARYDRTGRSGNHMFPSIVFYPACYPHKVPERPQWRSGLMDSKGKPLKELDVVMEFAMKSLLQYYMPHLREGFEIVNDVAGLQCTEKRRVKFTFLVQDPKEYAANLVERAYQTFSLWRDEMHGDDSYSIETLTLWGQAKADLDVDDV